MLGRRGAGAGRGRGAAPWMWRTHRAGRRRAPRRASQTPRRRRRWAAPACRMCPAPHAAQRHGHRVSMRRARARIYLVCTLTRLCSADDALRSGRQPVPASHAADAHHHRKRRRLTRSRHLAGPRRDGGAPWMRHLHTAPTSHTRALTHNATAARISVSPLCDHSMLVLPLALHPSTTLPLAHSTAFGTA